MTRLTPINHPWIDSRNAPVYTMTFPPRTTDEDIEAFASARETWAKHAKYPVSWVVDLSGILEATAKQRRAFATHLERFEAHDIAWNRGSAIIVPNMFLRGIVTAIFWIKPPKFPNEFFANAERAKTWAAERVAAASASATP